MDAYLARIGVPRPPSADIDALRELQRAHLATVPFENLSIHLGEPIVLDEPALLAKVVDRRRGGFCYELNGAFAALLTALGYRVTLLSARVFAGDKAGPPFDHLVLRVDLAEPWLVDVGFGAFSHHPLRMDARSDQHDPGGVFQVVEHQGPGGHGDLDVIMDGTPQYRLDRRPYELGDFIPTCWWQQTSPRSHFTRSLTCSLLTESGRVTLSGTRLIHTVNGEREEHVLDDSRLLSAYRTHFGIALDRVPTVAAGDRHRPGE
ncbi:arylamine N-acetyltransferase [Actinomadura sp. HBU206391]|uniref:arylamine N-acetyltransferase family protein n=1 Tax=Actinomadura sp. HBU206391 TaxID=2731692 RepID=UPI002905DE34|nr:arylamine N-acetyltransferase [Actinomadura sp. HBU206391]